MYWQPNVCATVWTVRASYSRRVKRCSKKRATWLPGVMLAFHLQLLRRLRMSGAVSPLPPTRRHGSERDVTLTCLSFGRKMIQKGPIAQCPVGLLSCHPTNAATAPTAPTAPRTSVVMNSEQKRCAYDRYAQIFRKCKQCGKGKGKRTPSKYGGADNSLTRPD